MTDYVNVKSRHDNITMLNPHTNMTVSECLDYCQVEKSDYSDVVVLAYVDGELTIRSSHMPRKDALWMLMAAVDHTLGRERSYD